MGDHRERLNSEKGQLEYERWLNDPITQEIIRIIKEETRITAVPALAMTDPAYAASLYHHRVGVDATIATMESLMTAPPLEELEATYGADETQETTADED